MNKKRIVAVLALAVLIAAGAFGQIMFGVTGALHMDEKKSASEIQDAFETGQGIWYGGFGEIAFGRLGFGLAFNTTAAYPGYWGSDFMDMDISGYLSYHLFRARSFLDPFVELGAGYIGSDYVNDSDGGYAGVPESANLYWYGALGFGVNLGPIGVFGKFAYNNKMNRTLTMTDDYGTEIEVPAYGYYDEFYNFYEYLPKYRFTLGAKLIL